MKKFLSLIIVVILGIIGAVLGYYLNQEGSDLSADDSSALFGGVAESGYPSAGYIVTMVPNGRKTCAASALDENTAVTAGHCVDDATGIYIGKGDYKTYRNEDIQVSSAVQKAGWVRSQDREEDFAILNFSSDNYFEEFADVESPEEGCGYRVVAYGRTEDPDDPPMLRKSAELCITDIQEDTFKVSGTGDSGICYGDSGSPVYIEGTNKLVGMIVSIVNKIPNDPEPCNFGNTAIAVRVDSNLGLIKQTTADATSDSDTQDPSISVAKEFEVTVADESFSDKIGLYKLRDMDQKKLLSYVSFGLAGLAIAAFIYLLVKVLRSDGSYSEVKPYI